MRTIKFRGKRVDNGEWVYGSFVDIQPNYEIVEENGTRNEVIPETVGQITGLLDKNGKEIYDGSRLKSYHFNDGKKDHYLYHTVTWSDKFNAWQCVAEGQDGTEPNGNPLLFVYLKATEFEVIGNIHDK